MNGVSSLKTERRARAAPQSGEHGTHGVRRRRPAGQDRPHPAPRPILRTPNTANRGRTKSAVFQGIAQELHTALEHDQFVLHYQPIVDLGSGDTVAAEALLRWDRSLDELAAAESFIEIAEETGLIVSIGTWVIGNAARQAATWAETGLGIQRVAVNVSAREFLHGRIYDTVLRALDETGVDPRLLSLEITERVALADLDHAAGTLGRLRALGIHTALDDFGTGYSSLSYLQKLPIDTLKIDRSFVAAAAAGSPQSEPILSSIVDLAHRLDMTVVAEGIETDHCLDLVRSLGCEMAQGYHLGRPAPAEALGTTPRVCVSGCA